jgi:L-seryl-tRNA(Ser) seleniumtransferase
VNPDHAERTLSDDRPANRLYRKLPQLDELLARPQLRELLASYPHAFVADSARIVLDEIRHQIKASKHSEETLELCLAQLTVAIGKELRNRLRPSLRQVINATGVILQTNLGRAPLSEAAILSMAEAASGYCNLEMDLETGQRSRRDVHVEQLILRLLAMRKGLSKKKFPETQAAAVVNNCAAATFLALNSLAEGGEVIVSRGELVEIGGGFRIPDILRKSGARLREVGTTNRTRIADYAAAITPETRLILRVHQSNFKIEGFTESPSLTELIELSAKASIPIFEDQGTGCVVDLAEYGIPNESSWGASATSGATLVASSGDKLLGGPQCGILIGEHSVIERIRANPLYRALRVDKLTYAALQATLLTYIAGNEQSLPIISMLRMPSETIKQRCEIWTQDLQSPWLSAEVTPTRSLVGGGTTPGASLPSFAVALKHAQMSESTLAALLRRLDPPILTRTSDDRVLLDLRTVPATNDRDIIRLLHKALGAENAADKAP